MSALFTSWTGPWLYLLVVVLTYCQSFETWPLVMKPGKVSEVRKEYQHVFVAAWLDNVQCAADCDTRATMASAETDHFIVLMTETEDSKTDVCYLNNAHRRQ